MLTPFVPTSIDGAGSEVSATAISKTTPLPADGLYNFYQLKTCDIRIGVLTDAT